MDSFFNNIYFAIQDKTDAYILEGQHVVMIGKMLDEFTGEILYQNAVGWFLRNVMDHCPIYANFRANIDADCWL